MKIRTILTAVLLVICLLMSGFSKKQELYQRLIIKAIGIDKTAEQYEVTVRVADYAEDKEYNLHCQGESVYSAMSSLQLAEGRTPMYSHSHFIIFGHNAVKDGLTAPLDFFVRFYKAHPGVELFAAAETAAEILDYKNEDGFIPSDRIIKLSTAEDISGKTICSNMAELVGDMIGPSECAVMPEMELTQNGAALTGTQVIRGGKYAADLSEYETLGLLAARGELREGVLTARRPETALITGEVIACRSDIKASEGHHSWTVDIHADMSLASVSNGACAFSEEEYKSMEVSFAQLLREYAVRAISASYSSGCDTLELGKNIYREDPRYWKQNSGNWLSMLPSLDFQVRVTVSLVRLGEEEHFR